jgi:DNA-binding CsgD family transcriptional regulator
MSATSAPRADAIAPSRRCPRLAAYGSNCSGAIAGTTKDKLVERLAFLTDAERRVSALAGRGHTNREIASSLFITVSTVEQHLTRVYRKLNLKRREDLPVELLQISPSEEGADAVQGLKS